MSKIHEQSSDPYTGGRWVSYWVDHLGAALQFLKQNRQALHAEPLKDSTAKLGDLILTFTQQLHPIVDRVRTYLDTAQSVPAKRPIELPINTGGRSSIPGGIPKSPVSSQLPAAPSWGGNKQVTVADMTLLGNVLSELAKVQGIKPQDAQELEESVVALLVDLKPYLEAVKAPVNLLGLCEELEECDGELTEDDRKHLFTKFPITELFSPAGPGAAQAPAPQAPQPQPQAQTNQLDPQKLLKILQRGMDAYKKAEQTIDLQWLEQKPDTQQHLTNALTAMNEAYLMVRNVAGMVKGNPQQRPQESIKNEELTGPTEKFICTKCGISVPKGTGSSAPTCPKCKAPMGIVKESAEILDALARITG